MAEVVDTKGRPLVLGAHVMINVAGADHVACMAEALLFGEHEARPENLYSPTSRYWRIALRLRHSGGGVQGLVVDIDIKRQVVGVKLEGPVETRWLIKARAVTVLDEQPVRAHDVGLPHPQRKPLCSTATLTFLTSGAACTCRRWPSCLLPCRRPRACSVVTPPHRPRLPRPPPTSRLLQALSRYLPTR